MCSLNGKKKKDSLYKMFGNNYIITRKISDDYEEKTILAEDRYLFENKINELNNCLNLTALNEIIAYKSNFYGNKIIEKVIFEIEDKEIVVNAGTKLSKSFKYFFEDNEKVRILQDFYSTLVQKGKKALK